MINTDRLINAITEKVVNWQFRDCYETEDYAKRMCALMYGEQGVKGVTVRPIGHDKFATLFWSKETL